MKILLVEDEDDLRSILSRSLSLRCGVTVLEAGSVQQAIALAESTPDLALVISDYQMPSGTGGQLFQHLRARPELARLPFVLHSSQSPGDCPEFAGAQLAGYAPKPNSLDRLAALIEKHRDKEEAIDTASFSVFFPVGLDILSRVGPACCPYYLRLSESKHVKVLNAGDPFDAAERARFAAKGLDRLQIRAEDCARLVAAIARRAAGAGPSTADLATPQGIERLAESIEEPEIRQDLQSVATLLKLVKTGALPAENALDPSLSLHERLVVHFKTLGFSPAVHRQAEVSVQFALSVMSSIKALKPLLEKMKKTEASYLSAHSVFTAYLACALCMEMPWESEENRHKLVMAAFLHDILLEDERLGRVRRLDEKLDPRVAGLSEESLQLVREHPAETLAFVRRADPILAHNLEPLILHHHERADGTGFPGALNPAGMSPLQAVFLVAHDLADFLLTSGEEASLLDFLVLYRDEYATGPFPKVVAVIDQLVEG